MKKVSEKTIRFLKDNVKDLDSFLPLDDDKRYDLIQLVETLYVIPLSNAESAGEKINETLLSAADDVIDDLNLEDLDFDDFNRRIK